MTSSPRDNDREQHWETAMPWVERRPLLWRTRQSWDEGFGEETIAIYGGPLFVDYYGDTDKVGSWIQTGILEKIRCSHAQFLY